VHPAATRTWPYPPVGAGELTGTHTTHFTGNAEKLGIFDFYTVPDTKNAADSHFSRGNKSSIFFGGRHTQLGGSVSAAPSCAGHPPPCGSFLGQPAGWDSPASAVVWDSPAVMARGWHVVRVARLDTAFELVNFGARYWD
jgi:hypothetical protein